MANTFINLVGNTTTTGVHLETILRRGGDGLPVYGGRCIKCGCTGIPVVHRKVSQESVHCPNERCSRLINAPESKGTAAAQVVAGFHPSSARAKADREAFRQLQQVVTPKLIEKVDTHFVHPTVRCWCSVCKAKRARETS